MTPPDASSRSRVVTQDDYSRLQAAEWHAWRGEISSSLKHIEEKLNQHIIDDKDALSQLLISLAQQGQQREAGDGGIWERVNKLDRRITFYVGGGAAVVLIVNLVIAALAVYSQWK